MKLSELKKIIRESVLELKNEQVVANPNPGGSCNLNIADVINGPYPNQFEPNVWVGKWEDFKAQNNLGCNWVKGKYIKWTHVLGDLQSKTPPKCNKRWQGMLQFKIKHVQTNHGQCI